MGGRAGALMEGPGGGRAVIEAGAADVGSTRERRRLHRLAVLAVLLGPPAAYLWWRILTGDAVDVLGLPGAVLGSIDWLVMAPILFFVALIALLGGSYLVSGRSPHTLFRPEQIDVRLDDVVGIDVVKEEVVRSLNLFLAHKTFTAATGGRPRRGLLFEGPPGTGKTHTAKAVAAEAGVPFLFASATSFQSSFYGATARKLRSYFTELRRLAAREGGAIGFIDEFDAIAGTRHGMEFSTRPAGEPGWLPCSTMRALPASYAGMAGSRPPAVAGAGLVSHRFGTADIAGPVVNELLVQLQSFDQPTGTQKLVGKLIDAINGFLPAHRALPKPAVEPANIMLIASTNRADGLDPALLRPGRFDRRLAFEPPDRAGRRALLDHFLAGKAHEAALDADEPRDTLAGLTAGYSPAMIEHLLDEALVNALRRGQTTMSWADLEAARLTEEVGLGQPVGYTAHEKRLIATHEAGHAALAWLVAPHRRLDILSIIKRKSALGMLAHGDREDVFTQSRTEMLALIQVSLAGQCAEETFFGDISTGPSGDLLYATNVAAQMVGACGMTGTLVSYAAVQNSAFNDSNIVGRVLADERGRETVEALLQEQKTHVRRLVSEHRHLIEALRDALLERHELIGTQITDVIEAAARAHAEAGGVIDLRGADTPLA
ncbi:MAG TPA: AAA family ATPase [Actinomycetes bacterium]|nr:AAA family ATPase [Actinomycetes bacterium]